MKSVKHYDYWIIITQIPLLKNEEVNRQRGHDTSPHIVGEIITKFVLHVLWKV